MYYTLCETFLDISQALIPPSDFRTFRRVKHKDSLQCVSEQRLHHFVILPHVGTMQTSFQIFTWLCCSMYQVSDLNHFEKAFLPYIPKHISHHFFIRLLGSKQN